MNNSVIEALKKQFEASLSMFENAINNCPENVWTGKSLFWYKAFHTLFYLDYYLSQDASKFSPPLPFTESEFEGKMPERNYSKPELIQYLNHCKEKFSDIFQNLNGESLNKRWSNSSKTMNYSFIELIIYNIRHTQHHVGQLNLILRQESNNAADWQG